MVNASSRLTAVLPGWVSYLGGHRDGLTPTDGAKKVESLTQLEVG